MKPLSEIEVCVDLEKYVLSFCCNMETCSIALPKSKKMYYPYFALFDSSSSMKQITITEMKKGVITEFKEKKTTDHHNLTRKEKNDKDWKIKSGDDVDLLELECESGNECEGFSDCVFDCLSASISFDILVENIEQNILVGLNNHYVGLNNGRIFGTANDGRIFIHVPIGGVSKGTICNVRVEDGELRFGINGNFAEEQIDLEEEEDFYFYFKIMGKGKIKIVKN